MDNLRRQVEEVKALRATFPEDGAFVFTPTERLAFEQATVVTEREEIGDVEQADLSGTVNLLGCRLDGQLVAVRFSLPPSYPLEPPTVQVMCTADRYSHDHLTATVSRCLEANWGTEILLLVLEAVRAAVEEMKGPAAEVSEATLTPQPKKRVCISRKAIWFHHIKSVAKRKNIASWAQELGIRGVSKPGFPGVIVCEGQEDDVKSHMQEYYERVRHMRWQAISVRAEEREEASAGQPSSVWRFGAGLKEVGEGDMDVVASECRAAGLDHLFRAAIKL